MNNNYIVVRGDTYVDLEFNVNDKIKHGYKPQGSVVFVDQPRKSVYFLQAMVMDEDGDYHAVSING